MRIYNATKSRLDLPLGCERISIQSKSVSGDIMPSIEFLSTLVSSFDYNELALIVSGPFEINMCASVSGSVGFVVQSLDEAIQKFAPKSEKKEEKFVEPASEDVDNVEISAVEGEVIFEPTQPQEEEETPQPKVTKPVVSKKGKK